MPLHAYSAPPQHLRQSKSALTLNDKSKHPLTSSPLDPAIARQHALIAANKAMERSQSTASSSVSREDSKRSVRTTRSIHFAQNGRRKMQQSMTTGSHHRVSANSQETELDLSPDRRLFYHDLITAPSEEAPVGVFGSQPSSYRRLKKAKSSINTRFGGHTTDDTRKLSRARSMRRASSSLSLHAPSLRLKLRRSLNLLRPHRKPSEQVIPYQPELTCRPESIVLARCEFLKNYPPQSGSTCAPTTPTSVSTSVGKPLRRSVRSHPAISSVRLPPSDAIRSAPTEKRSISATLRRKLKQTFSRSAKPEDELPPQQVEARHDHFNESLATPEPKDAFDSYCDDDPELTRRNSLYFASIDENQPMDLKSDHDADQGSLRAPQSLRSSQSRLTSWTNSSICGSIRSDVGESKRLSVIREDGGPHQPSSSAGRHVGGLSVFQQPLQLSHGVPIDSQRVYSALVKRMDQEQAEMERTEVALRKIHETRGKYLPKAPSTTVRQVSSDGSIFVSNSGGDDITSPPEDQSNELATDSKRQRSRSKGRHRRARPSEQTSTFFAPSIQKESQTPSPFRRLLQQNRFQEHTAKTNIRGRDETVYKKSLQSSESIYSTTTDGGVNPDYTTPIMNTESFQPLKGRAQGVATITYSQYAKPKEPASRRCITGASMTASEKGRWQGWLESEMADLADNDRTIRIHVREHAQIDPYNVEVGPNVYTAIRPPHRDHISVQSSSSHDENTFVRSSSSTLALVPAKLCTPCTPTNCVSKQSSITCTNAGIVKDDLSKEEPREASTLVGGQHDKQTSATSKPFVPRKASFNDINKFLRLRRSRSALSSRATLRKENRCRRQESNEVQSASKVKYNTSSNADLGTALRESSINTRWASNDKIDSPLTPSIDGDGQNSIERSKTKLSARLSRPFDMDVPEYNRPFDSMYLGKLDRPASENSRTARLSVAASTRPLRSTKSYGGIGRPRIKPVSFAPADDLDMVPTALPTVPDEGSDGRTVSSSSIVNNSRRMVSNFLRSRRKQSATNGKDLENAPMSSPAFI